MFHLIPFAAGIAVGAVAVKMLKGVRIKKEVAKASDCLREAAVSGLGAVEKSAGKLKDKLAAEAAPEPAVGAVEQSAPKPSATKKRKRSTKRQPPAEG
jgi:hypothetical protein